MAAALIVLAVAALVIVAAMLIPLLATGRQGDTQTPAEARRAVQEDLERSLKAIQEIEHDRAAGHLSDADFEELDRVERARAVELMRRRDAIDAEGGS